MSASWPAAGPHKQKAFSNPDSNWGFWIQSPACLPLLWRALHCSAPYESNRSDRPSYASKKIEQTEFLIFYLYIKSSYKHDQHRRRGPIPKASLTPYYYYDAGARRYRSRWRGMLHRGFQFEFPKNFKIFNVSAGLPLLSRKKLNFSFLHMSRDPVGRESARGRAK